MPSAIPASSSLAQAVVHALSETQACAVLGALPRDRQAAILRGGFQLTPASAGTPMIRQRLGQFLEQQPELLQQIGEMTPAPWQATLQILSMLDAGWLQREWRSLVRNEALPHLLLAAAFCTERPGLQARARRWFRHRPAQSRAWRSSDLPTGWQAWQRLAGTTTEAKPEPIRNPAGEAPAAGAKLRKRIDEADAARELAEQESRRWKKQAKMAEQELLSLRQSMKTQLDDAIAMARLELYGYSDKTDQLRQVLNPAGQNPEALARQTLARQAELDQHHGTRSALRQEQERLLALQQEMTRALQESLVVLPELRQAAHQVASRIGEIEKALSAEPQPSSLFADFLMRLRTLTPAAGGLAALESLEQLAKLLDDLALWSKAEAAEARRALRDQRQRLEIQASGKMPEKLGFADQAGQPPRFSLAWLRPGAPPHPEIRVFIDGYNAIKRNSPFSDIEASRGLASARREFVARCASVTSQVGHLEVVFDGSGTLQNQEAIAGVLVIYSPYQGKDQNADICLLERLKTARNDHPEAILVLVSDDGGLIVQAAAFKTAIVETANWIGLLRR